MAPIRKFRGRFITGLHPATNGESGKESSSRSLDLQNSKCRNISLLVLRLAENAQCAISIVRGKSELFMQLWQRLFLCINPDNQCHESRLANSQWVIVFLAPPLLICGDYLTL